jgi:hypothetical protein
MKVAWMALCCCLNTIAGATWSITHPMALMADGYFYPK